MKRAPWRRILAAVVLIAIAGISRTAAQEREVTPVTDAMLQNPDPADWLNWRRTLDGWGFRSLHPINHCK